MNTILILLAVWAQSEYSPYKEGNEWVYKTKEGDTFTVKVAGKQKIGSLECFQVETTGPIRTTKEFVAVTDEGEKVARRERYTYEPAYTRVKFPVKDGDKWEVDVTKKSDVEEDSKLKGTYEVMGIEDITVPAGSFTCFKIRYALEESGAGVDGIFWVSSGVGVVKKSFNAGGQQLVLELEKFNAPDYFPLKVGNKWTYNSGEKEIVIEVVGREKVGDVECFVVETATSGEDKTRELIAATRNGVLAYTTGGKRLDKPALTLQYPLKKGNKWSEQANGSGLEWQVEDEEEIQVSGGKFKCFKVVSGQSALWYAKDIGIVRIKSGKGLFNLVKFEPAK